MKTKHLTLLAVFAILTFVSETKILASDVQFFNEETKVLLKGGEDVSTVMLETKKIIGLPEKELSPEESRLEKMFHNEQKDSKGKWIQANDGRWWFQYYNGGYAVGWEKIDYKWYYFDTKGWMKSSTWIQPDGKWYYLTSSGAMAEGLYNINGTNHFFRESGAWAENKGLAIALYGQTFVGVLPYVWGGNSLETGVDCSGLTRELHKTFGIEIPRTSYDQLNAGYSVSYSSAKLGDIIVYGDGGHVAIYVGEGYVVHAPSPGNKVEKIKATQMGMSILDVRRCWE